MGIQQNTSYEWYALAFLALIYLRNSTGRHDQQRFSLFRKILNKDSAANKLSHFDSTKLFRMILNKKVLIFIMQHKKAQFCKDLGLVNKEAKVD